MANLDIIRGRQVVVPLTNKSGGAVAAGDVVVIGDGTNDGCFTTTTTAAFSARMIGIAQEAIADNASGRVLTNGYAPLVNVGASVDRDSFLFTDTTGGQATGSATRAEGAFGQVLTTSATPDAVIWGVPDVASGGGSALGDHGAAVYHDAAQNVATSTLTPLAFNSERWDTDGYHDPVTNNSRLTIPTGRAGKYLIIGNIAYGSTDPDGRRDARIMLNGTTIIAMHRNTPQTTYTGPVLCPSTIQSLSVGDYVELAAWQDSGSTLPVSLVANYTPEFRLQQLA